MTKEENIKEVMELVSRYGSLNYQECDADYRGHIAKSEIYAKDQREAYADIQSKLRELIQ